MTILRMTPDGSFADIPEEVRRRVDGGERVALLLLDALGLRFLHRHDDHPLVGRLELRPLRAQFPLGDIRPRHHHPLRPAGAGAWPL